MPRYAHTLAHVHAHTNSLSHTHTLVHMPTHAHIHMQAHTHAQALTQAHVCLCAHTHTHTCHLNTSEFTVNQMFVFSPLFHYIWLGKQMRVFSPVPKDLKSDSNSVGI